VGAGPFVPFSPSSGSSRWGWDQAKKALGPRHALSPSPMPPLRRQHHLRSALEAFLRQRDLEAAYRALTLGGWMAHYFQSRGPRQEAALKTHVREPSPIPPIPSPPCLLLLPC
jgi:hypothetical protein